MSLVKNDPTKPFRLRIPPTSPRNNHRFTDGRRFERNFKDRWYEITADDKKRFESTLLYDGNPSSPKLFQIVTAEQAREIDRQEGVVGAAAEQQSAAREAALRSEVAEAKSQVADMATSLSETNKRFGMLLDFMIRSNPAAAEEMALQFGLPAPQRDEAKTETKPVEKTPEKPAEVRPARPGDRANSGGARKSAKADKDAEAKPADAKPVAIADGEAGDPLGGKKAVEAHDAALAEAGMTPNR